MEQLQFVKSPHWKYFQEYLQERYNTELNRLIYADSEQDRIKAQGKIQVYAELLKLKEQLM